MTRLVRLLAAIVGLGIPALATAALESSLQGQSATHRVEITPYDAWEIAVVEGASIVVSEIDKDAEGYGVNSKTFRFGDECSMDKSGQSFSCRKNGQSILAGTTYRKTADATPRCAGLAAEHRFTRVAGFSERAPKYLAIVPYEC